MTCRTGTIRTKRPLLAACAALLSAQVAACPMSDWVAEHYGISFSGFATEIATTTAPDLKHGGPYVRVTLVDAAHVADGFRHAIVLDTTTKKAWILRTGGFVGVYQWYGPVDVGNVSLEHCRIEDTGLGAQRGKLR